jgi:hypothetical protein
MRDTGDEIHVGASFSDAEEDQLQKLDEYLFDKKPKSEDS